MAFLPQLALIAVIFSMLCHYFLVRQALVKILQLLKLIAKLFMMRFYDIHH